ncbi:hypothetical protein C8Q74DRAFT_1214409 [Fomes fomentarius]|nr:hypothetical protein C8Q74DRAFT_1214409 [Fomes fomentarius]
MSSTSETPSIFVPDLPQPSISRACSDAPSYLRPTTPSSVHSSSSETGDNDIIPPYHPAAPRTLVLCFDGTGDQFDSDNSNVVKFFSLLKRDDRREQMVYYQTGIGTYTSPQLSTGLGQAISKTLDEMVAWNLDTHVMGGYSFLMQNYEAGDKICLFGFSRGAYTARALAGMLHKVGLLPSHNHQQIPFAYKMYTRTDTIGWKQSVAFKKAFCIDVDIDFIGVWDTVNSVGVIPHRLPFTASNTAIRTFRHALSLDERRAKFKANHYQHPRPDEEHGTRPGDMPRPVDRGASVHRHTRPASQSKTHSSSSSTSKPMSPSRIMDSFMKHTRGATTATTATFATGSTAVTTPSGTVTKSATVAAAGVKVESSGFKKEAQVAVEAVSKEAETVVVALENATGSAAKAAGQASSRWWGTLRSMTRQKGKRLTDEEQDFNKEQVHVVQTETDVKEVWFAGCHCDVGGGSVLDETKYSLARIPLRWMIRECFRTNTGIRFHAELLKEIGLDPCTLWPGLRASVDEGMKHAPKLPPFMPGPRISLDPPTPQARTAEDIERDVVQALTAHRHTTPSRTGDGADTAQVNTRSTTTITTACADTTTTYAGAHGISRATAHARHISASTTRTCVGTISGVGNGKAPLHDEPSEIPVNEEEEERQDAMCPIYDQLSLKPWWWILELFPVEQGIVLSGGKHKKRSAVNLGGGRRVPPDTERFYVHKSVKYRMEQHPAGYKPKAQWGELQPIWTD